MKADSLPYPKECNIVSRWQVILKLLPFSESSTVLSWLPAETPGEDHEAGLNNFLQNRASTAVFCCSAVAKYHLFPPCASSCFAATCTYRYGIRSPCTSSAAGSQAPLLVHSERNSPTSSTSILSSYSTRVLKSSDTHVSQLRRGALFGPSSPVLRNDERQYCVEGLIDALSGTLSRAG